MVSTKEPIVKLPRTRSLFVKIMTRPRPPTIISSVLNLSLTVNRDTVIRARGEVGVAAKAEVVVVVVVAVDVVAVQVEVVTLKAT